MFLREVSAFNSSTSDGGRRMDEREEGTKGGREAGMGGRGQWGGGVRVGGGKRGAGMEGRGGR